RESRGIMLNNCQGRMLPTDDPHFYNPKKPGEGFPFDNLQASMMWTGTPVYVLRHTTDDAWVFVRAPSLDAWVKSTCVATVDKKFISSWTRQARKNLVAITQTDLGIKDKKYRRYRFSAYVGMVFPGVQKQNQFDLLIPISDTRQKAHISHALLPST